MSRLYHVALQDSGRWTAGDVEPCAENDDPRECCADGEMWATFEADGEPEVMLVA